MKKRLERRSLLLLFLLLIFCVAASIQINEKAKKNRLNLKTGSTEEFRKLGMEEAFFQVLAKTDHEKRGRLYAIYFLENSLFPQDNEKELFEKWSEKEEWKSFEKICTALWNDIRYFPVPESPKHPQYQVSFVDSWMGERTYGGKRGHEGCDLMASKDIPGLYPVVSMTDGVVSARGWLEKGGYRIGITAPSGAYFYYAHLDSYGSYQEGDEVKAGDIIGFMGNTGYGPEGTKGMFATHLHLGIYLYPDGEETSYNPYWILRLAEVPYIINSACGEVGGTAGAYCMAYGPLSNYEVAIFSDIDAQKSTEYKFKQGQIAYKACVFMGGNVVAKNGFIRVKNATA